MTTAALMELARKYAATEHGKRAALFFELQRECTPSRVMAMLRVCEAARVYLSGPHDTDNWLSMRKAIADLDKEMGHTEKGDEK